MRNVLFTLMLLLCSAGVSASSDTVKFLTAEEWQEVEQRCNADANCAANLARLKEGQQRSETELTALCETDIDACAEARRQRNFDRRAHLAHCDDANSCFQHLNETMDALEIAQEASAWCANDPVSCSEQYKLRSDRQTKNQTWCEMFADVCGAAKATAESGEAERELAVQRNAKWRLEFKSARNERASELAIGNAESWLESQAQCAGSSDCVERLNRTMETAEQNLRTMYCGKNEAVCETYMARKVARAKSGMTWCEQNAEVCESAFTKSMEREENEKRLALELEAVCAKSEDKCRARLAMEIDRFVESQLACIGGADQCRLEINERAKVAVEKAYRMAWCTQAKAQCEALAEQGRAKKSQSDGWCSENADRCDRIVASAKRNTGQDDGATRYDQRIQKLQLERLRETDQAMLRDMAIWLCEQSQAECEQNINTGIVAFENRLLESHCSERGNAARCQELTAAQKDRSAGGRSWCDQNAGMCADVRDRAARQVGRLAK